MLTTLESKSDLRPSSVNLEWTWKSAGDRPSLVLLRRTQGQPKYSTSLIRQQDLINQGLEVIDVEHNLTASEHWWKTQRMVFLARNDRIESNLQLAEFSQFFSASAPPLDTTNTLPNKIIVSYFSLPTNTLESIELTDITLINYTEPSSAVWNKVRVWEVFHAPLGVSISAGFVRVFSQHGDGFTSDRFSWEPVGSSIIEVEFETESQQLTEVNLIEKIVRDTGEWERKFNLTDQSLQPQEIYYYRLYLKQASNFLKTEYAWSTQSVASADYHFDQQLYQNLPAIHQYYDEPDEATRGQGQLRNYLSLAGASLDHSRSLIEVLKDRHNVNKVYSNALPSLARMIGWQPDITTNTVLLRKDIADAPDIYRTVGTVTNLRSVVNRVTGWDCKIKEFVHNVFLTNAIEKIKLWEIWSQHHDGVSWSTPTSLTTTDGMDAHPSALIDSSTTPWLFMHSDRVNNRSLWRRQLDVGDATPKELVLRKLEEREESSPIDEYPSAVFLVDRTWLVWASNQAGQWNIWASWSRSSEPFSNGPDSSETNQINPINVSDHAMNDRHPFALVDGDGNLRVFWQSDRRGLVDIWSRVYDGSSWSESERITTAEVRHLAPTAVIDLAQRIWLFFCDDTGEKTNIKVKLLITGVWTEDFEISQGKHHDEAPTAVFWNGQVQLFWHSNRNHKWQLMSQRLSWSGNEPTLVGSAQLVTDEVTADKEPFAMVNAATNRLHLFWRSQRRGIEYRSRSLDTNDAKMMGELRTFQDKAHYTYDTGTENNDQYARDTVGIFLTPDPEHPDINDRNRRLFNGPLREFIPINIRPILFILPEVHREYVYTYEFPEVEPQRFIGEEYSRVTTVLSDETYVGLDDNYIDTIDDWTWIRSWSASITDHHTVDTTTPLPIDIHFRTWHVGVSEGV